MNKNKAIHILIHHTIAYQIAIDLERSPLFEYTVPYFTYVSKSWKRILNYVTKQDIDHIIPYLEPWELQLLPCVPEVCCSLWETIASYLYLNEWVRIKPSFIWFISVHFGLLRSHLDTGESIDCTLYIFWCL